MHVCPLSYNARQLTLMRNVGLCERAFALSCMLPVCGRIVGKPVAFN